MTSDTSTAGLGQAQGAPGRRHRRLAWTAGVFALIALAAALAAAFWDWNWFRGPLAAMAAARMHRPVSITGNLRAHVLSWQPSATVEGVRIGGPAWAGPGDLARIDRIALRIRLVPLFTGRLDMRLLEFDRPQLSLYRDGQGRATWDFSDGARPDEPLRLPPIRRFVIDGGRVDYRDDDRRLYFKGSVEARETLGAANHGFEVVGQGTLNAKPFDLSVTGGPLLNIDRNKPYPFDARIHAGETYVTARGAVPKPFDLAHFQMDVSARGPDVDDLYGLTGIPLPNTPPFDLHGRLSRDERLWRVDGIGGRVGSSDLSGSLSVRSGKPRPFLTAELRSSRLDFPDLGALFGGGRKPGKVASPSQVAAARKLRAEQRIFPDATLNFDHIRAIDADVTFRAAAIVNAPIHLQSASARVKLTAGLLRAEPLVLEMPQGRISGWAQLNGRQRDAVTDLDLRLANGRLENLLPVTFQGSRPLAGALVGRARLHGVGDSVHDAIGDANGEVMFVTTGGEIRRSLAELSGVDVIKGLGLLWSKDRSTTPINCAVARFDVKDGVMSADRLVIDTGPVRIDGAGVVNLDKETVALRLRGHPKRFQLVRLLAPITVSGPLLHPTSHVETGQAFAQGAAALALGAALSPLAMVLPFLDAGLAKDVNCQALMAEGRSAGAPVRSAAVKAPPGRGR